MGKSGPHTAHSRIVMALQSFYKYAMLSNQHTTTRPRRPCLFSWADVIIFGIVP